MFLLDTNVVSELRKKHCNPQVRQWMLGRNIDKFFISVATLYEIRRGICAQEKTDPDFAHMLSGWLLALRRQFGDRILPVTEHVAEEWAMISFMTRNTSIDNLIAATAKVHDLTVATRNIKHFRQTGASCVNPWE